jgi:hypothetical protein
MDSICNPRYPFQGRTTPQMYPKICAKAHNIEAALWQDPIHFWSQISALPSKTELSARYCRLLTHGAEQHTNVVLKRVPTRVYWHQQNCPKCTSISMNWEFHPILGVFWSLDESNIYPRVGAPKQRDSMFSHEGAYLPQWRMWLCAHKKGCFLTWQSNVPFVVESRKLLSTPQTKGSHSTK